MGCAVVTQSSGPVEGKYPNKFFKAHCGPVDELLVASATSVAPAFEIERVCTVHLIRQPTCVELSRRGEEGPFKPSVLRESWALFNDSKSTAKISATFFHAEDIAVLCGEDPDGAVQAQGDAPFYVTRSGTVVERKGEGDSQRLTISVTLKPAQTIAFVDGVTTGGYMWKCMVESRDGDLMATPVDQA